VDEVDEGAREKLAFVVSERGERRIQPLEMAVGPGDAEHVEREREELLEHLMLAAELCPLLGFALPHAHLLGHVLHAMNDVEELSGRVQDG
jgi:hypothetical protein